MNRCLQETSFPKQPARSLSERLDSIKGKLEERRPARGKPSLAGPAGHTKLVPAHFTTDQLFVGDSTTAEGVVAALDGHGDGVTRR